MTFWKRITMEMSGKTSGCQGVWEEGKEMNRQSTKEQVGEDGDEAF